MTEEGTILWGIFEFMTPQRSVRICRANGYACDSEGPELYSREEAERFIGELREAVERVWPKSQRCRRCGGGGREMQTPGGGFDLNPGNRMYDVGPCRRCGGSGDEPEDAT